MNKLSDLINPIRILHNQVRDAVVHACETASFLDKPIAKVEEGDTIYAIDRISEELLVEYFSREIAVHTPIILIAEGLDEGELVP